MVIKSAKYYKNLDNTINYIKVTTDDNTIIHVPIHTLLTQITKQSLNGQR